MANKLKLKHYSSYLPHSLKIDWHGENSDWGELYHGNSNGFERINIRDALERQARPILSHTCEISKNEILKEYNKLGLNEVFIFSNIWLIICRKRFELLPECLFEYLLKNRYDVFGLIEKGLALDKRTIKNDAEG